MENFSRIQTKFSASQEFVPNRIFVGSLPDTVKDFDLRNYFSKFGEVVDANIVYDQSRKASKGFGFVSFKSDEDARNVLEQAALKDFCIGDRKLNIAPAIKRESNKNIFDSPLPPYSPLLLSPENNNYSSISPTYIYPSSNDVSAVAGAAEPCQIPVVQAPSYSVIYPQGIVYFPQQNYSYPVQNAMWNENCSPAPVQWVAAPPAGSVYNQNASNMPLQYIYAVEPMMNAEHLQPPISNLSRIKNGSEGNVDVNPCVGINGGPQSYQVANYAIPPFPHPHTPQQQNLLGQLSPNNCQQCIATKAGEDPCGASVPSIKKVPIEEYVKENNMKDMGSGILVTGNNNIGYDDRAKVDPPNGGGGGGNSTANNGGGIETSGAPFEEFQDATQKVIYDNHLTRNYYNNNDISYSNPKFVKRGRGDRGGRNNYGGAQRGFNSYRMQVPRQQQSYIFFSGNPNVQPPHHQQAKRYEPNVSGGPFVPYAYSGRSRALSHGGRYYKRGSARNGGENLSPGFQNGKYDSNVESVTCNMEEMSMNP